jgi:hypothetical protein
MKFTLVIAALVATSGAVKLDKQWPSVARCKPGQVSYDHDACDNWNQGPNTLDGTAVQTHSEWPSVARCVPGQVSYDHDACDNWNKGPNSLDGTVVQLSEETVYRPVIKCAEESYTNPVTCDYDDIKDANPLPKVRGITPTKTVPGGPLV